MFRFSVLSIFSVMFVLPHASAEEISLARKLEILVKTYPDILAGTSSGRLYFKDDSAPLVIDDGREKSHQQTLMSPDIEDMLSQTYPMGICEVVPVVNFDPGRIRVDSLFKRLYGANKGEVRNRLVKVKWFNGRLRFNSSYGAAKALERVKAEIAKLPTRVRRPAKKSAGTFKWRKIAGTKRLSVHSFGAAIDLDINYANYWRWSGGKPGKVPIYKNKVPMQIVDIFERHGFVWGGRWYHYDTMHFEYRPELIAISRESNADACSGK